MYIVEYIKQLLCFHGYIWCDPAFVTWDCVVFSPGDHGFCIRKNREVSCNSPFKKG